MILFCSSRPSSKPSIASTSIDGPIPIGIHSNPALKITNESIRHLSSYLVHCTQNSLLVGIIGMGLIGWSPPRHPNPPRMTRPWSFQPSLGCRSPISDFVLHIIIKQCETKRLLGSWCRCRRRCRWPYRIQFKNLQNEPAVSIIFLAFPSTRIRNPSI